MVSDCLSVASVRAGKEEQEKCTDVGFRFLYESVASRGLWRGERPPRDASFCLLPQVPDVRG